YPGQLADVLLELGGGALDDGLVARHHGGGLQAVERGARRRRAILLQVISLAVDGAGPSVGVRRAAIAARHSHGRHRGDTLPGPIVGLHDGQNRVVDPGRSETGVRHACIIRTGVRTVNPDVNVPDAVGVHGSWTAASLTAWGRRRPGMSTCGREQSAQWRMW